MSENNLDLNDWGMFCNFLFNLIIEKLKDFGYQDVTSDHNEYIKKLDIKYFSETEFVVLRKY